ncbi:hypothetical protein [Nitrincola sp. MINF-07-Sa-05]|uniref:hypothetical protein n=1 Tax=Nitrincola salilacus TaxID=3400273 RepID=UPI003917C033
MLNGQRGYWQNALTQRWIDSLTPERIDYLAREHKLDPFELCSDPYRKRMTGGSDDHNGIFAGRCGTLLPTVSDGQYFRFRAACNSYLSNMDSANSF